MSVVELDLKDLTSEKQKGLEWFLPNSLGDYSSSTITGKNTKDYHGLMVSSSYFDSNSIFRRRVVLKELKEVIYLGKEKIIDFASDKTRISKFIFDSYSVNFFFNNDFADIKKTISSIPGKNGITVNYEIILNKKVVKNDIKFVVNTIFNSSAFTLINENNVDLLNERTFSLKSDDFFFISSSDKALSFKGFEENKKEGIFSPAHFSMKLMLPNEKTILKLIFLLGKNRENALNDFKNLQDSVKVKSRVFSSGIGIPILNLLSTAQRFIVKKDPKLGIVAGYPFYEERGWESMMSIPGLFFINSQFENAERVFERFLNSASRRGIPDRFVNEDVLYENFDTSLLLIDRLYQYMKAIGKEQFRNFLHTYWWNLLDIMRNYSEKEKDGILENAGRDTWMKGINRPFAIEVQGLWYNSLRIMDEFSLLMGGNKSDNLEINFQAYAKAHEEAFLETFWNGSYLNDFLSDESLRPNQLIVLGLDYCAVPNKFAEKILLQIENNLLTEYGLRSLGRFDKKYKKEDKFNGGIFPWLLSLFIKARKKFCEKSKNDYELIKTLFEKHVNKEGCIGSISEYFEEKDDGGKYEPKGCSSYSVSVSELLRVYFEDVVERRPKKDILENLVIKG